MAKDRKNHSVLTRFSYQSGFSLEAFRFIISPQNTPSFPKNTYSAKSQEWGLYDPSSHEPNLHQSELKINPQREPAFICQMACGHDCQCRTCTSAKYAYIPKDTSFPPQKSLNSGTSWHLHFHVSSLPCYSLLCTRLLYFSDSLIQRKANTPCWVPGTPNQAEILKRQQQRQRKLNKSTFFYIWSRPLWLSSILSHFFFTWG